MNKKETLELGKLFADLIKELKEIRALIASQKQQKQLKRRLDNKQLDVFEMDYTPSPFSRVPITTQNEALEQILVRSGMMSRETWEVLAGVQYDAVGANLEDDSFLESRDFEEDGEFEQSRFASYYERKTERVEIPNVETKKVDAAPAPEPAVAVEKKEEVKND